MKIVAVGVHSCWAGAQMRSSRSPGSCTGHPRVARTRFLRGALLIALAALESACASSTGDDLEKSIRTGPFISTGYVVKRTEGCNYFVVREWSVDTVLERRDGDQPDVGDKIIGRFGEFGFKDLYNATKKTKLHVRVEDYWLTEEDASRKLNEKCGV